MCVLQAAASARASVSASALGAALVAFSAACMLVVEARSSISISSSSCRVTSSGVCSLHRAVA
eukprot:12011-Heterococcus_DN1.PRE.1